MLNRHIYRGKYQNKWVYGGYLKFLPYTPAPLSTKEIPETDYKHLIITEGFYDWNLPRDLKVYEVDKDTVGQCTGMKDIKGNYIFEGDVVTLEGGTPKTIVWDEHHFILKDTYIILCEMEISWYNIEVITS